MGNFCSVVGVVGLGGVFLWLIKNFSTMSNKLIPIERRDGVTLYGKIVGKGGKLGLYEVHSDFLGNNGVEYTDYKSAETRFKALIGVKNS